MRRASTSRAFVAGVVILAMLLSMTVLFGAQRSLARIISPSAKAKVQGVIEIRAEVNAPQVDYVVLVVDNDRPGSTNTFPASFELDTRELADGPHQVSVEAYSGFGLTGASKAITIYVRNGSGALVTAKRPARTQVAAKPTSRVTVAKAQPKTVAGVTVTPGLAVATDPAGAGSSRAAGTMAVRPMGPARRVAAGTTIGAPKAIAAAEGARSDAMMSPTMLGRGPTPEPTRTVTVRPMSPRGAGLAEAGGYAASASMPAATLPPVVRTARALPAAPRTHTVMLDGRLVEFDVRPVVKDGRIHGGFRALFANTGARVTWMSKTRTARSVSPALTVEVPTGSRVARVNGQGMDMGAKAELRDGRTIIPVRFFATATGSVMAWDGQAGIAYVRTPSRALARNSN